MKTTLTTQNQNAKHYKGETTGRYTLIAYDQATNTFHEVVTIIFTMGRSANASVVRCSVWVRDRIHTQGGFYTSGTGKAGGYGYHKESAAFADALDSAGIMLDKDISGVGSEAIREAVLSIGETLGYDKMHLVG